MAEQHKIARAAGLMSVATFISRILGFIRDMVLAFAFGASAMSDAFFMAFRIPNLLREIFAEGSMSSAVIPVLTGYRKDDPAEGVRLVRSLIGFVLVVVGTIVVLGIIFAPWIVAVMTPGFLSDPPKFSATVYMTRIMFPFLLFVSLASIQMAALNTSRVFFVPAAAPAVTNLTIIVIVLCSTGWFSLPVTAAAVGVVIGGLLHMAVQVPAFAREGYSPVPLFTFNHPGLRRVLTLVLPVTIGMAAAQINIVVSSILASFLESGSVTYLNYAMRLIQFPVGIFGVAMGMAALPSLSEHARARDHDSLRRDFSFALRFLFFLSIPAMAGLIALRVPIVATLFERGAFGRADVDGTAVALLCYSIGIWAIVGVRVLSATFYAMQDTRTPVKSSVIAIIANMLLSMILMVKYRHAGIALAGALSSTVNFMLLFTLLRRKLGRIDTRRILGSMARIVAAALGMAVVGALVSRMPLWAASGQGARKAAVLAGAITLSVAVYFIICAALRMEEMATLTRLVRERINRKKG